MEDNHDEQDDKVLVHGQGQADENGVENDAKFQDGDADNLSKGRIGPGIGHGGGFFVPFLAVNVVVISRGVAFCRGD